MVEDTLSKTATGEGLLCTLLLNQVWPLICRGDDLSARVALLLHYLTAARATITNWRRTVLATAVWVLKVPASDNLVPYVTRIHKPLTNRSVLCHMSPATHDRPFTGCKHLTGQLS